MLYDALQCTFDGFDDVCSNKLGGIEDGLAACYLASNRFVPGCANVALTENFSRSQHQRSPASKPFSLRSNRRREGTC